MQTRMINKYLDSLTMFNNDCKNQLKTYCETNVSLNDLKNHVQLMYVKSTYKIKHLDIAIVQDAVTDIAMYLHYLIDMRRRGYTCIITYFYHYILEQLDVAENKPYIALLRNIDCMKLSSMDKQAAMICILDALMLHDNVDTRVILSLSNELYRWFNDYITGYNDFIKLVGE